MNSGEFRIRVNSVDQHLNTRVTPEAHRRLLLKCARLGVSPYAYLRELINRDFGHQEVRPRPRIVFCKKVSPEAVPRTIEEQVLYEKSPEYLDLLKYCREKTTD